MLFGMLLSGLVVVVPFQFSQAVDLIPTPIDDEMRVELSGNYKIESWADNNQDDLDFSSQGNESGGIKTKSALKAGLYSALLPGAGEYYLGHKKKARMFFVADVITWLSYFTFRTYSGWREDDFIRLAEVGAGAQLEGKSDEFHDLVGFFDDIDEANRVGRISNPEREFLESTPENYWRWVNLDDRQTYRALKNQSRESKRRADFMFGVAIVNRIVSVVDAVITAKRDERKIDTEFSELKQPSYQFQIDPMSLDRQFSFTYFVDF